MINRKSTFFLGIFIFLVPFLGLPSSWKMMLITMSGLGLMLLSMKLTLPKRQGKNRGRKEKSTPVFVESIQMNPRNETFEAKTSEPEISLGPDIK